MDINECETLGNVCHVTGYCQNLDGTYECRCPDERPFGDGRIGCFTLAEIQSVHGVSVQPPDVQTGSATNQTDGIVIADQIKDTVVQIELPTPPVVSTTQASTVSTAKLTTTTTRATTTTTVATTKTTTPVEVLIAEFTSPIINNDFDCAGQGHVCDFFRNDSELIFIKNYTYFITKITNLITVVRMILRYTVSTTVTAVYFVKMEVLQLVSSHFNASPLERKRNRVGLTQVGFLVNFAC